VSVTVDELATAMQHWGLLEKPAPPAALAWIATFLEAFVVESVEEAQPHVRALRAEACTIPALELERLRSRSVLFFIDAVGQYVDAAPELRGLPLEADLPAIASEFGLAPEEASRCVRMALTGQAEGPPLALLFPLLGHDRILMRVGAVSSKLLHGRGLEPIAFGPDGKAFEPIRGRRPGASAPGDSSG